MIHNSVVQVPLPWGYRSLTLLISARHLVCTLGYRIRYSTIHSSVVDDVSVPAAYRSNIKTSMLFSGIKNGGDKKIKKADFLS